MLSGGGHRSRGKLCSGDWRIGGKFGNVDGRSGREFGIHFGRDFGVWEGWEINGGGTGIEGDIIVSV